LYDKNNNNNNNNDDDDRLPPPPAHSFTWNNQSINQSIDQSTMVSLTPKSRAEEVTGQAMNEGLTNGILVLIPSIGALFAALQNPNFRKVNQNNNNNSQSQQQQQPPKRIRLGRRRL
jgi:hypothetical protein